jgi:hypothetical protein
MSARDGVDHLPLTGRGYSAGGSLVSYPRPDEIVVPLRRDEFDTLCEGGVSEEKASRDLYVGIGAGALAGLVGVLATTDWGTAWQPGHRGWVFSSLLVLCVMVAGSVVGACIHHIRLNQTISSSAFSRLRLRLLRLFDEPRTLEAAIERLPGIVAKQITASPGARWENVANLFWLGSDLCWTDWKVKSGAPKERILHGLGQSYHHLVQLGLATSDPGKQLSILRSQAESTPEAALSQQWRNDFAGKLSQVAHGLSGMAKSQQPGFQPNPR